MKLRINDRDYDLVWGLPAISQYCENVGHADDMEKAFDLVWPMNPSDYPVLKIVKAKLELIYSAIQIGCELNREECDLSRIELQSFIDNAEQGIIEDIFEDFFKSKYMGKAVQDYLFESIKEGENQKGAKTEKKSRRAS